MLKELSFLVLSKVFILDTSKIDYKYCRILQLYLLWRLALWFSRYPMWYNHSKTHTSLQCISTLTWISNLTDDMDDSLTCGQTVFVGNGVDVQLMALGMRASVLSSTLCPVYLYGDYNLQVRVHTVNISDCKVQLDLYNGQNISGETLVSTELSLQFDASVRNSA